MSPPRGSRATFPPAVDAASSDALVVLAVAALASVPLALLAMLLADLPRIGEIVFVTAAPSIAALAAGACRSRG